MTLVEWFMFLVCVGVVLRLVWKLIVYNPRGWR